MGLYSDQDTADAADFRFHAEREDAPLPEADSDTIRRELAEDAVWQRQALDRMQTRGPGSVHDYAMNGGRR